MRWTTKSTWIRIAVLFGIYLLVLAAWFSVSRVSNSAHRAIVNARENKIRA